MDTASLPVLVVKIGGRVAAEETLMAALATELADLAGSKYRVLLVHGGGVTISTLQERFGISPRFVEGLRQTDPGEMPLVDMALAGAVNKHLVRLITAAGGTAWGLSGADARLIRAESRTGDPETNRTGIVTAVDAGPVRIIWESGCLPVMAPVATDKTGLGINVNADEAALAVAVTLPADRLVFISDVPGVLEDGDTIPSLTPAIIEEKIESGVIDGGMIPKTRSAAAALADGVGEVIIGDYPDAGGLMGLLEGKRGTKIAAGGYQHG